MAVTKEVYALTAGFTSSDVINQLGSAFIDAGLMTSWYDTFTISDRTYGVLECVYDPTKTFGTTYYLFTANASFVGVNVGTGWNTTTNEFTGTQYLDYSLQPSNIFFTGSSQRSTEVVLPLNYNNLSTLNIYRYTSTASANQSWFMFQQGLSISWPFAIHNPAQTLYPWLDLDLGMIPGLYAVRTGVSNSAGALTFYLQENIRRAYPYGQALLDFTDSINGLGTFHSLLKGTYAYWGTGKTPNSAGGNLTLGANGLTIIPVGSAAANPAYAQDFVPICSQLPWTSFSSTPLATDFGVYMHYANNTMNFEDRFVVDPGVEEWEILACSNNPTVTTGASPTFLARVV
jgi:hypothetical protein